VETQVKCKSGLPPAGFSEHLLSTTVFLHRQDTAPHLPPLSKKVHGIEMDEDGLCMNYLQAYRTGKLQPPNAQ